MTRPTSTAQMPSNTLAYYALKHGQRYHTRRFAPDKVHIGVFSTNCIWFSIDMPVILRQRRKSGFALLEMLVVVAIIGLMTGVAMLNFAGKAGSSSFKNEALEIVNVMKKAQNAAARNGNRYAVIFDLVEQTYTLQQVNTLDELLPDAIAQEEMLFSTTQLSERCWVDHITFDDLSDTRTYGEIEDQESFKTYFIAGRYGWQNGGKIGLLDLDGNPYSIIINRLSKSILFEEGDIDIFFLEPKTELRF